MPINTITVGAAVAPTIIETYISHYLNRRPLKQKPTAHISYHEGLELIRRFLHYSSFHAVEEIQAFTSQWVPVPVWVHVEQLVIPHAQLKLSADHVRAHLGPDGIKAIGGNTWWQWRREGSEALKAEWIEMRKDMEERKKSPNVKGQRVMLYVHGGAYYFGSVDEHRYQMQRHARKLKARVLAPRYRLAPQFPFPCGLMDCLAAYLWLLEEKHDPSTIILAGDSAGGGMVLTMLVVMRDQGIPLPAGAILLSPWVDLTHSFPSLAGDGKLDYIPPHGFVHKPSVSWPPPNADDLLAYEGNKPIDEKAKPDTAATKEEKKEEKSAQKEEKQDRVRGFSLTNAEKPDLGTLSNAPISDESNGAGTETWISHDGKYSIGPKSMLSLQLDGKLIEIKDQIQLYAPNHMLTHPLVSPALQPSLGGLPPLLIQVGGGELLRDEQIYIAHKAAQPLAYLPPPSNHQTAQAISEQAARYRPTNVQLQVWDDLCHVAPTLSFTRPAKHMYRGVAQFGAWALARAQKTSIDIMDDDNISIVSSDSGSTSSDSQLGAEDIKLSMPQSAQHVGFESVSTKKEQGAVVGRAGDPIPPFENHMIRQRVDRHGRIYPLPPPQELEALNMPSSDVGVPKKGPVNKWMKAQQQWNGKFAKQKLKIQRKRMRDMEKGYEGFDGETPPPTALAGRIVKGMKKEKKAKKSWGMAMWSFWGSKHDEATIGREEQANQSSEADPQQSTAAGASTTDGPSNTNPPPPPSPRASRRSKSKHLAPASAPSTRSRSRSRHSTVTDRGQITASTDELAQLAPPPTLAHVTVLAPERDGSNGAPTPTLVLSDGSNGQERPQSPPTLIPATDTLSTRPTRGGVAYPFTLRVGDDAGGDANASMLTLQSVNLGSPGLEEETKELVAIGGEPELEQSVERPGVERFVTAADIGALGGVENEKEEENEGTERPGVERFETAREDLSTLAAGVNGKA
ncbi:alpha/beta-hydrolase [Paraphaeosphaeria sporulosa]|uniref:Alpha/beta-hydrolase n=1 Tax=Paraphaeosphaeria sporulosa TaxID=1460663 RepID=A0A177BXE2_9PLEO|nr:alpha/beta-hydrolase [Paraphaeosphaeria sporulosa]OAF99984.1 alpha/beta-hydrolase [Paraphaeosphaeria sporulosa]